MKQGYKKEFKREVDISLFRLTSAFYKKALGHYKDDLPVGLIIHYNNSDDQTYKSHYVDGNLIGCELDIFQYQNYDRLITTGKYQNFYKANAKFGEQIIFK